MTNHKDETFSCDVCRKFYTRINCECDDCYIKGAKKEFEKGKAQALEDVEKIIDDFAFSGDKDDNILIKRELKQKIKELK